MDDKEKRQKLVVLQGTSKKGNKEVQLSDEEKALKDKLLEIEQKLDSVENVIQAVQQERPGTIFAEDVFSTIVGAIAVTAATNVLADYFNVAKKDVDDLLL